MRMRATIIAAAAAAALAAPAAASASTISYEGDTLVLRALPGEANFVVVDGDDQQVTFTDDHPIAFPAEHCSQSDPEYPVACDTPARAVRIELGDGADHGSFGFSIPTDRAFTIDGGPGADLITGPRNGWGSATLDGGDGPDDLRSEETADTLLGGAGDDKLSAGKGADVLHGGEGDDVLRDDDGLTPASDLLDGGPGVDLLDAYRDGDPALAAPVDILLDGLPNDGPPGNDDNVVGVERFDVGAIRTFVGDDADNEFHAPEAGAAARLSGGGGNDTLVATDADGDQLDGGPGDDTLTGGMGADTIVGGPGRDTVMGDRQARCNELHCDFMDGYGDDTIDVRDGEADTVQCGPGADTVRADAVDRVADDCERVDGAVAGGGGTTNTTNKTDVIKNDRTKKQDKDKDKAKAKAKRPAPLAVVGSRRLADVLRHGLRVRLTATRRTATVAARLAGHLVAKGRGRGTVRLRVTAAGRTRLRHARRATLTVTAGHDHVRVTLTRR
jgi:Ca2+-binding RTX toxin-like protein